MPISTHDYLISVDPNTVLWRYINFPKFLSLLKTRSLFFCRADKFSDPFEGTVPKEEVNFRPLGYRQICEMLNIPFEEEKFRRQEEQTIDFNKRTRMGTVINSWQINSHESDFMWKLYLKTNEGVAVQTTYQRLVDSLQSTKEIIYPSKVRYIDYNTRIWYDSVEYSVKHVNSLTPFLHKRIEFKSENEFRLFHEIHDVVFYQGESYWSKMKNHIGIFITIDVEQLVERIIFPPNLNDYEQEKIELEVKNLGFDFIFQKSNMDSNPYY